MELNPNLSFIYDTPTTVVMRYRKQQGYWFPSAAVEPFTCAATGLACYPRMMVYSSVEFPNVLISSEGMYRLKQQALAFLD